MARPLIQEGSTGPDVIEAILRLNLAGADPQVPPTEPFDARGTEAAKSFQTSHGLFPDGQIGQDTWPLLDQLDGGRLATAADVDAVVVARDQARALIAAGDFANAKTLLEPIYANPSIPPEVRSPITANLGAAEHGLGNFDRARALYSEQLMTLLLFGGLALAVRDTLQRLREVTLGQPPGDLPSAVNKQNLPPNG
jgi:peptidoglycan hydrolase-like protein with peptidoglycan-binding domain